MMALKTEVIQVRPKPHPMRSRWHKKQGRRVYVGAQNRGAKR